MKTSPPTPPVPGILKHLTAIPAAGHSARQVFGDWLDLTQACLEALPRHVHSARAGRPLEDTPEVQRIFAEQRARYPLPASWDHFAAALALLLESAAEWQDAVGAVYMQFGQPNPRSGQFFTPWNIAVCMAQISLHDIHSQIHARIKTAVAGDPLAGALTLAGLAARTPQQAAEWFHTRILPAVAAHVEPLTVMDCCCGSGVMLLAAASQCPPWALDYGLVRFYGVDIDPTCVKMARVNCMLYGLNGYRLRCALALDGAELHALPQPYQAAYAEAQHANQANDRPRLEQIAAQLRQPALFTLPAAARPGARRRRPPRKPAPPHPTGLF